MKLLDFPLIKITFFFVIGIIIAYALPTTVTISFYLILAILLLLSLVLSNRFKKQKYNLFGIFTILTSCVLGILVFNIHDESLYNDHYTNLEIDHDKNHDIVVKVSKRLKPNFNQNRFITEIIAIDDHYTQGKLLLNIVIDSSSSDIKIDDLIVMTSRLNDIKPPLNPGQFNYKRYLEKQYIYHQVNLDPSGYLAIKKHKRTLSGMASAVRIKINMSLKRHDLSKDELSIINALLLGQREDISPEIYNSYVNAGVIHILAVSGLHIGIILLILHFLFKPLDSFRSGKTIKVVIILGLLWSFAIIAGLSPSVTRAVTMFSILAIGLNLKRPANIYNTLAISILVILLVKPMFLFEVGFQLSYLAVLGIVVLQPKIYGLLEFNWKIPDYFWKLFSVTLAAQIGVLPLSLFYFHQFPGLFFISNLLIIPFLGVVLGLGILVIFLSLINSLPESVAQIFALLIDLMNKIVGWTASKESFVFQDISFDIYDLFATYLLIFAVTAFFTFKNFRSILLLGVSIIVFQIIAIGTIFDKKSEEFIIFHKVGESSVGKKIGDKLRVYTKNPQQEKDLMFLRDYKIKKELKSVSKEILGNAYRFKNKTILIVDSLGIYDTSFDTDIIVLSNSPKINFSRLVDSVQPQLIIADGSNYRTYVERWKSTCINKKIPFHATAEKGAYILKD